MSEPFPDFLKISVSEDSLNLRVLNIFVSDPLHSLDRKDINVAWKKADQIDITFTGKATYEVNLDTSQKTARRIK